ncbi:MAG: hypothetical protein AB1736_06500 [Chloroflexota bacterium]
MNRRQRPTDHRRLATAAAVLAATMVVLAGCGQTASPSPAPATASPTPAATDSAPPGTATPAAPDAGAEAALDAFFATVAEPEALSFHLRQEATLETGGVPFITAEYDLDVAGTAFAGAASAGGLGSQVEFELVLVGDRAWIKVDDGDWTETDPAALGPEDIVDVWRYVAPRVDLEFEGRDEAGNLRFRSTTPMPYETGSMRESGMTGQITGQVLVLTPAGVPVGLELAIEAAGAIGEQELDFAGTTTIEFSRWGEPITIEPPIR